MTAIDNQPENSNFLSPSNFKFQIKKTPNLNFFVQSINIPGIAITPAYQPNPFVTIPHSGEHIDYDDILLSFKVDENLENYLEIHNWIKQLGFPDNYSQYRQIATQAPMSGLGIKSDISLLILNNAKNPRFNIVFKDAFPIQLSACIFETTLEDVQFIEASATFKYRSFTVESI